MCGLCGAACLFSRGGNGRPAGVDRYSDLDGREAAQGASMTPRKFNKPEAPPANSVRMDAARLNRFLDERDAATEQGDNHPRRDFVRWPFRNTGIPLTLSHPGGSQTTFVVACRNLSSGGIGLLHSAYVHCGTACIVLLPRADGTTSTVQGTVVRCTHLTGTIHEVGIRFESPIDPKQFVQLDPFANGFSVETVDPEKLRGTALFIGASTLDHALVRHFLRVTQVGLVVAPNLEEALQRAIAGVDVILCDSDCGDLAGPEIVRGLRAAGLSQPILMVTADTSETTRRELIKAQATAFITKPINQDTLFRALAEYMGTGNGGFASTLPEGHPNFTLLETFVEGLHEQAALLTAAIEQKSVQKARAICLQVAGSTPVMGFERIASLAKAGEQALAAGASVADVDVTLRMLAAACQRASSRPAA